MKHPSPYHPSPIYHHPPHTLSEAQRLVSPPPLDHECNIFSFQNAWDLPSLSPTLSPAFLTLPNGAKLNGLKRTNEIFWREAWHKHCYGWEARREVEGCTCTPWCLSLVQSPYVHISVSAEAPLRLDVVICMDLKRRWGGFPRHSWVIVTIEACWIKTLGLW